MVFRSINNHIKSSLKFFSSRHGSVPEIFWLILEPEIVPKPPHSCVRQNIPLSPKKIPHRTHVVQIWEWRRPHFFAPELRKMTGASLGVFFWRVRRWSLFNFWLLCVVFVGDKGLFCGTHEGGGFETVSGSKMGQSTSGTLPWRWTNSKEDLIWLLMLRKTILKNKVID